MKKILCLIFIFVMFSLQNVFCSPTTSNNAFEIPIENVPPGEKKSSGGLSGGAVTAITLGSVFGGLAALGSVAWYFSKRSGGLTAGFACGCNSPYSTVCIDNNLLEKLQKDPCKNKYLIKAFEKINSDKNLQKKYLLVQDTEIANKTYNTVFFELPEFTNSTYINVKIIQVSDPFNLENKMPSLNSKIMLNPKDKSIKEVATTVLKNDSQNGILIKQGQIKDFLNKTAAVVTEYNSDLKKSNSQNYALILEFSN